MCLLRQKSKKCVLSPNSKVTFLLVEFSYALIFYNNFTSTIPYCSTSIKEFFNTKRLFASNSSCLDSRPWHDSSTCYLPRHSSFLKMKFISVLLVLMMTKVKELSEWEKIDESWSACGWKNVADIQWLLCCLYFWSVLTRKAQKSLKFCLKSFRQL